MSTIVVVAPALVGLTLLWWLQRRTLSNTFVLAVLPLALLSVVVEMSPAARQMIDAFVGIAEGAAGSRERIAAMSASMTRTLVFDVAIFLLVMIGAGTLQAWKAFEQSPLELDPESPLDAVQSRRTASRWKAWVLPATSVVAVPVVFLLYNTARIADLVGLIADPVRAEDAALTYAVGLVGVESVSELSGRLSAWLVTSAVGGMVASQLLVVLGVLNILLVGSRKVAHSATLYSWVVLGAACLGGSVALVLLNR